MRSWNNYKRSLSANISNQGMNPLYAPVDEEGNWFKSASRQ